jgi:curved DNA-binding protein
VELTLKEAYEGTKKLLADDLEVTIPKGVFEGQTIRFSGRGEAGFGDADPGDLFLKIKFQPDVQWRTVGRDVYGGPVLLAPWEAALGVRTRVRTPTGEVDVTIPQGWLYGRVLRLKGRGIPAGASAPKAGDLFLDLAVALPRADGPAARDAYAAMASAFPEFVPRTA